MDLTTILPLVSAIFVLGLGLFVLTKNTKSRLHVTFFLHAIAISFWLFATFMMFLNKGNVDQIVFWDRLVYAGVVFIPAFMYHFCLALTNRSKDFYLYLAYALSAFFLVISRTDLFVKDTFVYQWGVHTKAQIFHHLFLLYFTAYVIAGFVIIYQYYRQTTNSSIRRQQVKYSFLAFLLLFTIGPLAFLPAYGIGIYPFAYLSGVIFSIILSYAILRYRLMDIQIIARKIFIYSGVAVFAYFVFYFLAWIHTEFFGGIFTTKSYLFGIIAAPAFVFLLYKAEDVIKKIANKYFFFALYNYQETINRISEQLTYHTDLNEIVNLINKTMSEIMGVRSSQVLIIDQKSRKKDVLRKYLSKNQKPLVFEELDLSLSNNHSAEERKELESVHEQMAKMEASLCLPVSSNGQLIAIIALGPKIIGDPFSSEDLELLMTLSNQAGIAIENARLYQEVKDFSQTLQQKVNEQTKDLAAANDKLWSANERLKELDRQKTEFVSIASHQLRSPLTAIKGYSSMLLEGSFGPVEDKARGAIDRIFESSQRLMNVIEDFLNITRIELGRMKYESQIFDADQVAETIIKDQTPTIKKYGLEISFETDGTKHCISADPGKVAQVFSNIIDNATKYTKKGSITIKLETRKDEKGGEFVRFSSRDTGVGIDQATIPKLFEKFVRAYDAGKTNFIGTGLGLYVAKQIVEGMNGRIWAESEGKGKGSSFFVEFPKADGELTQTDHKIEAYTKADLGKLKKK